VPKAIISNRIYIEKLTAEQLKTLTDKLTYQLVKNTFQRMPNGKLNPKRQVEYLKSFSLLPGGIVTIPQGRLDLIPEGYTVLDKRVTVEVPFPNPKFPLRESQLEVYNAVTDSCIINAKVGWGKSFAGLYLARKFGQKTLVITHTTALRDQWGVEVERLFGMPAGVIGSGKFDIEDHAIVVSNIQSLKKHINEISKEFGTVILDECLDYETQVITQEYGPIKIGKLVNQKIQANVLSVNTNSGIAEYKPVKQWFKTPETLCLKIEHSGGGTLKCTPNHSVYVLDDNTPVKKSAIDIEVGDLLLQTTTQHKSTYIVAKDWQDVLLGMMLGDGWVGKAHKRSDSVRLSVTHGEDQIEYLTWKADILESTEPTFGSTVSGFSDKAVYSYTTKSFYDHTGIFKEVYRDGHKKFISERVSELLSAKSWAIMFQDDGSSSKRNVTITFSFCELDSESIRNLQKSLAKLFDIHDSVEFDCNKGHKYLRLNKEATLKFVNGIKHLVHPSMYYKIENYVDTQLLKFEFITPECPVFISGYAVRRVTGISTSTLTGGYKYNIEVADNHNYFANGILVSNCHHVPATTFTDVINSLYARYRIGLSGTMDRKDGKHVLLTDFFSPEVFRPPVDNTMPPLVHIVKPGVYLEPNLPWANKINALLYDPDYQKFIADLSRGLIDRGHSVLVIASRVEFLECVKELIGETCVLVTGTTNETQQERARVEQQINSGEKRCIAGSRQIFSEGISINRLSAVVLAEPMSHSGLVEQIIGRVMRPHPEKPNPEVFDINFSDRSSRTQNEARLGFYLSKGWDVQQY
jgi:superfamily II DNA or RNA helicase